MHHDQEMTRGTTRRWWVLALALVMGFATACGGDAAPATAAGGGAQTSAGTGSGSGEGDDADGGGDGISLTVGVDSQNFMTNMPLYVGRDKGFFEDAGITDLEIVVTSDQYAAALLSGSVDISHAPTLDWFAAGSQSGEDIRWIATLRDREWLQLGVGPDVESVEDLRGGRVTGGPAGGDNEANLRFVLGELGLEPGADVEIVPSDPGSDNWLAAVLAGQLDGAMLFARHIKPLEDAGGQFLYQDARETPQDGFATTGAFMDDNPEAVDAFLEGLVATKQYYSDLATKEEVLQILRDNDFDVTAELEASYDAELGQQSADGGFDVANMEALTEKGIEQEQVPADIAWRDLVDLESLWRAQEANGLPRRPESL